MPYICRFNEQERVEQVGANDKLECTLSSLVACACAFSFCAFGITDWSLKMFDNTEYEHCM